jgi:hypothetical protein
MTLRCNLCITLIFTLSDGRCLLLDAATRGHLSAVQMLVAARADLGIRSKCAIGSLYVDMCGLSYLQCCFLMFLHVGCLSILPALRHCFSADLVPLRCTRRR